MKRNNGSILIIAWLVSFVSDTVYPGWLAPSDSDSEEADGALEGGQEQDGVQEEDLVEEQGWPQPGAAASPGGGGGRLVPEGQALQGRNYKLYHRVI